MTRLPLSLCAPAAALALLTAAAPAQAQITAVPGIQSVRVWESTNAIPDAPFTFAIDDARLLQRLAGGALSGSSRDFGNYPGDENYDIFLSDANGALDPAGRYVTIEGNCFVPYNCFNLNEVALIVNGSPVFATELARAVYGRGGSFTAGSANRVIDGAMITYTQMGDTIGLGADARMSVTVGFAAVPVPEPASALLLALGVAALSLRRLRRG
jgi:hypothetical protein